MKVKFVALLKEVSLWTRYIYFMRFGILLWIFPLALIWLNSPLRGRSLVSGIVTPSRAIQYLCVAFFLVSSSFVALVLIRIVVINGVERFGDACPRLLVHLLANDEREHEWIAPVVSQLNTAIVFWYFFSNGSSELVPLSEIAKGLGAGVVFAFLFWYAVNAFYYLTYRADPHRADAVARTLLFPRSWLLLSHGETRNRAGDALESASTATWFDGVARIYPVPGYRWPPRGDLYEGHYFAMIAAIGFFALYWMLWPLTAPLTIAFWPWVSVALYFLGGLAVVAVVFTASPGRSADAASLTAWKIALAVAILFFAAAIPALYIFDDAERFPIFALVLILVIGAVWALGAIAFFADRYRIPVLTLVILAIAIPRYAGVYSGDEEHYLSTASRQAEPNLPTPEELLEKKLASDPNRPLIVVTSTGGGIHAAAWTTAILGRLETEFAKDKGLDSFHDRILLLSTVSGGSSGLYDYLRELDPNSNGGHSDWDRMAVAARCSSLEAVGWGLVYYDFPKAFVPLAPYVWPLSPGVNDLNDSPMGKDRTWALRTAFTRNLDDSYCRLDPGSSAMIPRAEIAAEEPVERAHTQELTLARLDASAGAFPAFTMNTTTVENGERFLLSNYKLPASVPGLATDYRARSFLTTFTSGSPDLPLATTAQMSATFPLVSSSARVPYAIDSSPASVHFVDGGYYDNDGTASAIEFLRYAISAWQPHGCESAKPSEKPPAQKPGENSHPCVARILLIEIRNSGDVDPTPPESTPDHSGATKPWNLADQAMAPLNAFYGAGHESVTARNRTALEILEQALKNKLQVQRIVFADTNAEKTARTDPLNWSLTPCQIAEVSNSAKALSSNYAEAACWAAHWDELWGKSPQEQAAVCGTTAASAIVGPAQQPGGECTSHF